MHRVFSYWVTATLLALATLLVPSSASAGLCTRCEGKMFTTDVGKCVGCGGATTSGAFSYCGACSAKLNQCKACRVVLSPGETDTPPLLASIATNKPVAAPVAPATAGLCASCEGKMFTADVGKCVGCGGATTSGAFSFCGACSAKLNQCKACRATLSAVQTGTPSLVASIATSTSVVPPVVSQAAHVDVPAGQRTGSATPSPAKK